MRNKVAITFLLNMLALNASAGLITANKFEVGTNISKIDPNVTMSIVISDQVGSAFVPKFYDALVLSNPAGSALSAIGCTDSGATQNGRLMTEGGGSPGMTLDDRLTQKDSFNGGRSAMMLISYVEPTRKLSYQAVDWYGDGVIALAFDKDKNFIGEYSGTNYIDDYESHWGESVPVRRFNQTNHFTSDVYYILLGGYYSSAYITGIDTSTSVPEPKSLALIFIGILGLFFKHKNVRAKLKRR
ncbi:MAG: PEP-CTERM sorting domain-containing protein [Cellvibrio sp.]|uniref:PEP-CTERM sorting domain-containing protein n=1 Tax=Cellvibrio sp. TaxID=1965322 RepID=UPI0031A38160